MLLTLCYPILYLPMLGESSFTSLVLQLIPPKGWRQAQTKLCLSLIQVPPFWHGELTQAEYCPVIEREKSQQLQVAMICTYPNSRYSNIAQSFQYSGKPLKQFRKPAELLPNVPCVKANSRSSPSNIVAYLFA